MFVIQYANKGTKQKKNIVRVHVFEILAKFYDKSFSVDFSYMVHWHFFPQNTMKKDFHTTFEDIFNKIMKENVGGFV